MAGSQVGGDWYDVIPLPRGRFALVIGDVQGHDVRAAGLMGQLRIALRAYAAEGHRPDAVLSRASHFFHGLTQGNHDEDPDDVRFATCYYAEVDSATGTVESARAGHPGPGRAHGGRHGRWPAPTAGRTAARHRPGRRLPHHPASPWSPARPSCSAPTAWSRPAATTCETGWGRHPQRSSRTAEGEPGRDWPTPWSRPCHGPSSHRTDRTRSADRREDDMALLLLHRESGDHVDARSPVRRAVMTVASAEHALNDLLRPIVKGYGSEKGYQQLAQSLQTFGGSGFLQEYPIQQYIRDSKIDTLYQGTTAIQGQDFFFRKIVRNQGAALNSLAEDIKKFLALGTGGEDVGAREHLAKAAVELEAIVGLMLTDLAATEQDVKNIYKVGLNTTRLLMASGDVIVGYLLLRGAAVAAEKLQTASGKDRAFYTGKIAAAKFFAANVLPGVTLARKVAEGVELDLMELDEAAF
ncbi:hypothetical protein SGRIM128S_01979 [Streptomyces griseomycini]